MSFKFEKLKVWQSAMNLGEEVNGLLKKYPVKENRNLVDQTNRSVDSIALNIAEGAFSQTIPEKKRFLGF